MGKTNRIKIFKISLFVIGIVILAVLISKAGPSEIIKIISGAKIKFLIAGFLVYLLLIVTRASKWFLLIKKIKPQVKFRNFLPIYLVNCLLGNITPFKSGEAASPFLLNKYLKIPVGQGLSIIVLDRFFELLLFSLIFATSIFYIINIGVARGLLLTVFEGALAVLFLVLTLLVIVIFSKKTSLKIIHLFNFAKKIPSIKSILEFLEKELNLFYEGMPEFKNKKVYRFLIPLTLFAWFLELLSFYLVINSVLPVAFLKAATAQLIAIAATLVTFMPFGPGEVGVVYIFKLFSYPESLSISGVLLVRLFLTGFQFLFGAIGSLFLKEREE